MKRFCFRILILSGLLAGAFLLLCSWGILDPSQRQEESQPVILPAVPALGVADQRLYDGPFLVLTDPTQSIPVGTQGVILPVKTADGKLGYVSRLPQAMDWGASSGDPARNEAIRAVTSQGDLHTVALISCLADDLAGQDRDLALLRESGSAWVDQAGQAWLDPTKEGTADYLMEICRETAALGFDEILLTDLACPREGTDLEPLCRTLQEAALDWPCLLSVVGGQDLPDTLLATFPGRVWARAEDLPRLSALDPVVLPALSAD